MCLEHFYEPAYPDQSRRPEKEIIHQSDLGCMVAAPSKAVVGKDETSFCTVGQEQYDILKLAWRERTAFQDKLIIGSSE